MSCAGASGLLLKDTEPAELVRAIELLARGDALLSPSLTRRLIAELASAPDPQLPSSELLDELTLRQGVEFVVWDEMYERLTSGDLCVVQAFNGDVVPYMEEFDNIDSALKESDGEQIRSRLSALANAVTTTREQAMLDEFPEIISDMDEGIIQIQLVVQELRDFSRKDRLEEEWFDGAYLDALEVEPLPENHPFWDMENVLLVPHDSHSSPYIGDRIVDMFCANLERYVKGEPLQNICDPKKGY